MNETQAHAEFNSFGNSFGRINDYFGSQVGRSQEQTQQSNVIAVLGKLVRLLQDLLPPQPAHASGLSGLFRQQFQAQQQLPPYSPLGNLFNNFGDRQAEQAAPFTTPLGRLVNQVSEKQGQQTAPFTTPLGRLVKQVSEKQGQQTAPFTTPLGRLVNQINDAEPLNPQPLPPVDLFNKKLGALEPLNPQPLPPVDLFNKKLGALEPLNPQPLPPVDLFNKKLGALDPLNPQPLPPVDLFNKKFGAIEPLNPQPLPPVDLYNKGLASVEPLNPQPLPPIDLFKTNGPLNRELFAFQTNQNDIINKSQILRAGERSLEQFQIQTIMSDYNNAETLSSSVQKKSNDTVSGIISKI